jgi:hypothetical protein
MDAQPPVMDKQRKSDADTLRILSICHFVVGGLGIVGLLFLGLHYMIMHAVMSDPKVFAQAKGTGPDPVAMFQVFRWVYLVMGVLCVVGGICNVLSGLFIRVRKHRVFSLIVAGLNAIHVPIGTALAVFTFVMLLKDSVRDSYEP